MELVLGKEGAGRCPQSLSFLRATWASLQELQHTVLVLQVHNSAPLPVKRGKYLKSGPFQRRLPELLFGLS